jgi:pyrroloquinoline quinone biosynthesis protein D
MSEGPRIPRFGVGVKFRFDEVRQAWILLAPERLFMPDEHAVEILKLIDGRRTIDDMAQDLAARFAAPRDIIADDIAALLQDLSDKGVVKL